MDHDINQCEISIIVPALNEKENISSFVDEVEQHLSTVCASWEILFIDDGSTDGTYEEIGRIAKINKKIRAVKFARNFGKEVALSAGFEFARGDAVIPMDADLQHPPELISEMIEIWREGVPMVIPVREHRQDNGLLSRFFAPLFYKIIKKMSKIDIVPNAGDYRLLDRKVVDTINSLPERARFMKGIYAWGGHKYVTIPMNVRLRASGAAKWNTLKLCKLAIDGMISFSNIPLHLWTYVGAIISMSSFVYLFVTILQTLILGKDVPGYASTISLVLLLNGLLICSNGIQGEYIARIFEESKKRPLFVVDDEL
jgi:glycosyltransferase involved in cell wall biosynthesis